MTSSKKVNLAALRKRLAPWEHVGFRVWKTGALVYGNLETGRINGWLHVVFPPIPEGNMKRVTDEVTFIKDYGYLNILGGINGAMLCSGMLELYGVHATGSALRGPGILFDIFAENVNFTRHVERHDGLVFGSAMFAPVMRLYIETRTGEILSVDEETSDIAHRWPDFDTFFWGEIDRLEGHLKPDGHVVDLQAAAKY